MKKNKKITISSLIFLAVVLILCGFIILKFIFHEDIPNFVFIIFGIAAILSPFVYFIAANKAPKTAKENNVLPLAIYFTATFLTLVVVFFVSRKNFLPLLICQIPMIAYFLFMARKKQQPSSNS